jgi:hypothetical protein
MYSSGKAPHACLVNVLVCAFPLRASYCSVRIEKVGDKQLVVHYEKDGEKMSMEAGLVLFGTGRKPNTDRLNLKARLSPHVQQSFHICCMRACNEASQ